MLLPVGHFEKPDIRAIAGELGLNVAEKKDSQGICFLGDVPINTFDLKDSVRRITEYYDDVLRHDVMKSVGASKAKLIILTNNNKETINQAVDIIQEECTFDPAMKYHRKIFSTCFLGVACREVAWAVPCTEDRAECIFIPILEA